MAANAATVMEYEHAAGPFRAGPPLAGNQRRLAEYPCGADYLTAVSLLLG